MSSEFLTPQDSSGRRRRKPNIVLSALVTAVLIALSAWLLLGNTVGRIWVDADGGMPQNVVRGLIAASIVVGLVAFVWARRRLHRKYGSDE